MVTSLSKIERLEKELPADDVELVDLDDVELAP